MLAATEQSSSAQEHLAQAAALDEQASRARAALEEALINLLQSQQPMQGLSAATRATMGKRGLSQLETVKGMMDEASTAAAHVHRGAFALRLELLAAHQLRDEAVGMAKLAAEVEARACTQVSCMPSRSKGLDHATAHCGGSQLCRLFRVAASGLRSPAR